MNIIVTTLVLQPLVLMTLYLSVSGAFTNRRVFQATCYILGALCALTIGIGGTPLANQGYDLLANNPGVARFCENRGHCGNNPTDPPWYPPCLRALPPLARRHRLRIEPQPFRPLSVKLIPEHMRNVSAHRDSRKITTAFSARAPPLFNEHMKKGMGPHKVAY